MTASVLPEESSDFVETDYWKSFYAKRGTNNQFEWYGDWQSLSATIEPFLRVSDQILQIGCGTSVLADELHDNGYRNVISVDNVNEAIVQQHRRNQKQRPTLRFICDDATNTSFEDLSFSAIIDKGTLDAMLPSADVSTETVDRLFDEMHRVLAPLGRYITITLAQRHILKTWLLYFSAHSYMLRVQLCGTQPSGHHVFALIATKLKIALPGPPVLQYACEQTGPPTRANCIDELLELVFVDQQNAMLQYRCQHGKLPNNYVETSILASDSDCDQIPVEIRQKPRFIISLVDAPHKRAIRTFAVMIVPQGRECQWIYATPEGNEELRSQAGCDRLAVVRLGREHAFPYGLEGIQDELNQTIMSYAPEHAIKDEKQVPYMIVSQQLSERTVRAEIQSDINGTIVVEDVVCEEEQLVRRMLFADSAYITQSEVTLIEKAPNAKLARKGKKNKKAATDATKENTELVPDLDSLSCEHHAVMVSALALAAHPAIQSSYKLTDFTGRVCILGLGAGLLAMFMRRKFPKLHITCVELDPFVVACAREWFGLVDDNDEHLDIHITDAIEFIQQQAASTSAQRFDLLLCDLAGTTEAAGGLSAPIPEILSDSCLNALRTMLSGNGWMVMNVITRSKEKLAQVFDTVESHFPSQVRINLTTDVNHLLLCPVNPDAICNLQRSDDKNENHNQFVNATKDIIGKYADELIALNVPEKVLDDLRLPID